jgi:histidine triad (HIT) family protein
VEGADNPPWVFQKDVFYRDAQTTAWVNGRCWPKNPGAVVVVPNAHVENIYELERNLAGAIHETARRISLAMKAEFSCDGTSTRQHNEPGANQEVWHDDDLYGSTPRLTTHRGASSVRSVAAGRARLITPSEAAVTLGGWRA